MSYMKQKLPNAKGIAYAGNFGFGEVPFVYFVVEEVSLERDIIDWKRLHKKKILITGATGLIGTALIESIMKKNRDYGADIFIYALSRSWEKLKRQFGNEDYAGNIALLEQDVSKEIKLEGIDPDYIIHAASNTHPREYATDPVGTITVNVFGAYQLLEYAKRHLKSRIVFLSSVEIYGENRTDKERFEETDCGYIDCNTLRAGYSESKRITEAMAQAYLAEHQVDSVTLRLCRTYGPTMNLDDSKALSQFILNAVRKEDIILKSQGMQLYSYIYVNDAVNAILKVMLDGQTGEVYNVADERSDIYLKDAAEMLAQMAGTKVVYETPDGEEQRGYSTATRAVLNSNKLKALGWEAEYTMQSGLEQTVNGLKKVLGEVH